jgi:hypothetical protein
MAVNLSVKRMNENAIFVLFGVDFFEQDFWGTTGEDGARKLGAESARQIFQIPASFTSAEAWGCTRSCGRPRHESMPGRLRASRKG